MANPSMNTVAQFAHAGMAYSITLSVVLVFGYHALWWFLPIAVGLAAGKEFWYDYKYETAEVRGSSWEDFMFYMVGITCALIGYFFMFRGSYDFSYGVGR